VHPTGHHDVVTSVWWYAAGALTVISAGLFRHHAATLSAANPAARLPWIGWPANRPRGAKVLAFFAVLSLILAGDCVTLEARLEQHLYDFLWCLPIALIVVVVAGAPQAQHNRRVRNMRSS
jgi:hypothetical protein